MIAGRRPPKITVPARDLRVLPAELACAAHNIRARVFGAPPIARSTDVSWEVSTDVTDELIEIRVNEDNRFAVGSDRWHGDTDLSVVACS